MRRIGLVLASLAWTGAFARAEPPPAPSPAAPVTPAAPAPELAPDTFAEVLQSAGLTEADLGFTPRGTWARYPVDVPWKLPFFDDLLAHPTESYEFTRTLGNAVEDLLTPASLSTPPKEGPGSLFKLGVILGTDRRIGGFRGFGMGLYDPKSEGAESMGALFRKLVGHTLEDDGTENWSTDPAVFDRVPLPARLPLARLVSSLLQAEGWIKTGTRNVSEKTRTGVVESLSWLVEATPDGNRYAAEVEDAARALDAHSVAYGGLRAMEAVQRARWDLEAARPKDGWPDFEVRFPTSSGEIVLAAGAKRVDIPGARAPFLVVHLQGPLTWTGPVAGARPDQPLSVALVMGGPFHLLPGPGPTPEATAGAVTGGAGVLGCGILYVAGAHDDRYEARSWAFGAALLGMGVLVDEGGNDTYSVRNVGEGAALFGAGLLLDAAGNDRYDLLEGDGQGFGGPGGVGILADRSGDDVYVAEPLPRKAGASRADYHSDQKIVGSNAQGAGMGRRGDVSDGHAWAGGLGALLDVDGNDTYSAGNFSQGVGYWFGTGILYDGGGDDTYDSVYFSHASGAHFAVGIVDDEGGNDVHRLSDFPQVGLGPKAGAGLAFGWDVVNAILFERAGNDRYESDIISEGCSNVRSHSWLLDEGGDDTYVAREGALAFGAIDEMPTYATPHRTAPFAFHLPQTAFLLDLGGTDRYLRRPAAGGDLVPDAVAGDGKSWGYDGPRGPGGGPNVARGRDVAHGRIGFLDAWPRRQPAPPPPPASTPAPAATPAPAPTK